METLTYEQWCDKVKKLNDYINSIPWDAKAERLQSEYDYLLTQEPKQEPKQEPENFDAEIQYQSKGTTPAGDPFMTVKKARGYYEYAERGGVDSVAFVLLKNDIDCWGLINESKPPRDEIEKERVMMTTAFGGSCDDKSLTPHQICKIEVEEESGYEVSDERIHFVGETLVSSQMSQMCHLFLVDVRGLTKTKKAEYENSVSEIQAKKDENEFSKNSVVWMDEEDLIENMDWKSITIMTLAFAQRIIC